MTIRTVDPGGNPGPRITAATVSGATVVLCLLLSVATAHAADLPTWTGQQAEVDQLTVRVARSPAQWRDLWVLVGRPPPRALAPHETGAAVFLGRRPTAGHAVVLERVESERGVDTLIFSQREPEGMAAQVMTAPWLVAVLPRKPILVTFLQQGQAARLMADGEVARLTLRLAEIGMFDARREAFCAEQLAECKKAAARLEALIGDCRTE